MLRTVSLLAALSLSAVAWPQAITPNPAVQQVQLLAPQLLAFAGSPANFQSLVNGLTQGTPVTLTSTNADGTVQVVTFVPGTALSATDAARVLEAARQSLITQGIALPTAQQVAVALMGGALPTALGSTTVSGVLTGNTGVTPIQVRNEAGTPLPGGTTGMSAANLAALQAALTRNTTITLPGATGNVTFAAPGRALTDFEASQAIQLATVLLAQQGIANPTAEQLRAALLGGSLGTASGGSVALQGVLQGQVRNTSDSPIVGTSNSPIVGTSNTPPQVSAPTSAIITGPAGSNPVLGAGGNAAFGAAGGAAAGSRAAGATAGGGTAAGRVANGVRFGAR